MLILVFIYNYGIICLIPYRKDTIVTITIAPVGTGDELNLESATTQRLMSWCSGEILAASVKRDGKGKAKNSNIGGIFRTDTVLVSDNGEEKVLLLKGTKFCIYHQNVRSAKQASKTLRLACFWPEPNNRSGPSVVAFSGKGFRVNDLAGVQRGRGLQSSRILSGSGSRGLVIR